MTTALAMRTGLPGTLRADGYDLPPNLTYEEWCSVLALTEHIASASPWWLGDALVYGEQRFPDLHTQALPTAEDDPDGARQSRMKSCVWVSSKFPPVTRVTTLSWSHHRAAAELDLTEARRLLEDAERQKWPTRKLIERVQDRQEQLRGRAFDADGVCAAESEPLIWVPQLDDLAPEMRRTIEAQAPVGRHRLGWIAGYLACLVWTEQRDAFKEWGA